MSGAANDDKPVMQFDAMIEKLIAQNGIAPEDVDSILLHLVRLRTALMPFARAAVFFPPDARIPLPAVDITFDDFRGALTAYDMAPPQNRDPV